VHVTPRLFFDTGFREKVLSRHLALKYNEFMNPIDKDQAYEVLAEVSEFLQGYEFFLDAGTLLGIYRSGDFIDHDTDIDFAIVIDPEKAMNFPVPDWPLVAVWDYRNLPMQRAYLYRGIIVDFYFYYSSFEEGVIVNFNDHGVLKLNLKDSLPTTTFTFKNLKVKMPHSPKDVLQSEYGFDWMVPKTSKGDWGDDRHNLYREFPGWPIGLENFKTNERMQILLAECQLNGALAMNLVEKLQKEVKELTNSRIWRFTSFYRKLRKLERHL
jgi:hypothetical protein